MAERIIQEKNKGHDVVVVVAGFQVITEDGDNSALGRGRSDITAVSE
ncbi:hypothetical protein N5C46_18175 [Rossellomorea vietnamensis]|uniref:Uncharacterized protein n=1 Tax=Rossellomorea vietnamensis TaxID=218284 RepID=A0ACD4C7L1_9BACI|nr:hypothetical protein [Rossellomorea vietnamensis]UXH43572.1 hypothetical protein N5C46_18175 [Rossellomorea vietnamensis]